MLPRASHTQEKNPVAKDENVRKEAGLKESLSSVQPMGNEAANVELMDQMLKDSNNDNNIIRNDTGSDISDESDLNIISTSSKPKKKKKPSKDDEKKALKMAEKIVQGQAPENNNDFAPLSTYALDEDMVVETGSKKSAKNKNHKKSPKQQNIVNPRSKSKITGLEALDEDARWKHEAGKRLKEVELRDGSEEEKAIIAICRMLLTAIWHILSDKKPYSPDGYLPPRTAKINRVLTTSQALNLLRSRGFIIKDDSVPVIA